MVRAVVVAVLFSLVASSAALSATKPQPYAWTPAQAVIQITSAKLEPFGNAHFGNLAVSYCAGRGKNVAKRYLSFACSATWSPKGIGETPKKLTLFAKVRPVGKGQPCVSLTPAVPAACLAKGIRLTGDTGAARVALAKQLGVNMGTSFPYQGPMECASFGASYFSCWFGANGEPTTPGMGHATVILAPKPIIAISAMPTSG